MAHIALSISISLMLILAGASSFPAVAEEMNVQHGTMKLVLSDDDAVVSLLNRETGWDHIAPGKSRPTPVWSLTLKTATGKKLSVHAGQKLEREISWKIIPEAAGIRARLIWHEVAVPTLEGSLDVMADVRLVGESPSLSFWTIDIANRTNATLSEVVYPQIGDIREPGDDPHLLHPSHYHYFTRHPEVVERREFYYPGMSPMQLFAYYGTRGGLYLAAHDGTGRQKSFRLPYDRETSRLGFAVAHPVPRSNEDNSAYRLPYEVVVGLFDGDWSEAALIYRGWATQQKWCAGGPMHERADAPDWLDAAPVWLKFNSPPRRMLPQAVAWSQFLQSPLPVHWAALQMANHDKRYPEYFPAHFDFPRVARQMVDAGIYPVPYVNSQIWDTLFTETWHTQKGVRGAVKNERGAPFTWQEQSTRFAMMCPASEHWRNTVLDITEKGLIEYGYQGIYYDQLSALGGQISCFDPEHGHALGGGNYWVAGNRTLLKSAAAIAGRAGKRPAFTSEGPQENYLDLIHAFYLKGGNPDHIVPAFNVVYKRYSSQYGHFEGADEFRRMPLELYRYFVARMYLWGNAYANWAYGGNLPNDNPRHAQFLRELVTSWQAGAREFLHGGTWERPIAVEGIRKVIAEPNGRAIPSVLHSAWRHRDDANRIGILLANPTEERHVVVLRIDPAAYGLSQRVGLWQSHPDEPAAIAAAGHLESVLHTLEPGSIHVLQLSEERPATNPTQRRNGMRNQHVFQWDNELDDAGAPEEKRARQHQRATLPGRGLWSSPDADIKHLYTEGRKEVELDVALARPFPHQPVPDFVMATEHSVSLADSASAEVTVFGMNEKGFRALVRPTAPNPITLLGLQDAATLRVIGPDRDERVRVRDGKAAMNLEVDMPFLLLYARAEDADNSGPLFLELEAPGSWLVPFVPLTIDYRLTNRGRSPIELQAPEWSLTTAAHPDAVSFDHGGGISSAPLAPGETRDGSLTVEITSNAMLQHIAGLRLRYGYDDQGVRLTAADEVLLEVNHPLRMDILPKDYHARRGLAIGRGGTGDVVLFVSNISPYPFEYRITAQPPPGWTAVPRDAPDGHLPPFMGEPPRTERHYQRGRNGDQPRRVHYRIAVPPDAEDGEVVFRIEYGPTTDAGAAQQRPRQVLPVFVVEQKQQPDQSEAERRRDELMGTEGVDTQ